MNPEERRSQVSLPLAYFNVITSGVLQLVVNSVDNTLLTRHEIDGGATGTF